MTPKSSSALSGNPRFSRTSHASHFSRSRGRATRSLSPSRARLLHSENEVHSDFEEDFEDYETADFYAQDASGIVGALVSPISSLTRTQSDARTPVRGRTEDEIYDEEADFARVRQSGWLPGIGSAPFSAAFTGRFWTRDSGSTAPPPGRQDSNETLPPAYTSRTPTFEIPPPHPTV